MLEKLRAKPDQVKKSLSLIFTVVVFSGIVFVWLTSGDARSKEEEIRDKTVSPIGGMKSMLDGLVVAFKDAISDAPSFVITNPTLATSTEKVVATSTNGFDLSGVMVIDSSTSTATVTSSPLAK